MPLPPSSFLILNSSFPSAAHKRIADLSRTPPHLPHAPPSQISFSSTHLCCRKDLAPHKPFRVSHTQPSPAWSGLCAGAPSTASCHDNGSLRERSDLIRK